MQVDDHSQDVPNFSDEVSNASITTEKVQSTPIASVNVSTIPVAAEQVTSPTLQPTHEYVRIDLVAVFSSALLVRGSTDSV